MKQYLRKNVSFDPENKDEMKLYEWLSKLKYGRFSEETKAFWLKKMKGEERQ